MRRYWIAVALGGLAVLSAFAVADDVKSVQVRARERVAAERPHKWAIVVGVNDYDDDRIQDLACSVADASAIYEVLVDPDRGGFLPGNVVLLTDTSGKKPTRNEILDALGTLAETAGPDGVVVFYFSGHGMEWAGEMCLLPRDVRLNSPKHTGVLLEAVEEVKQQSGCRVQVVIVDACRSDLKVGKKGSGGYTTSMEQALLGMGDGLAVLMSASGGQASYEDPDTGHSVFTRFLVEALEGQADTELSGNRDGLVSVYEAATYAAAEVRSWGMQHRRPQSPRLNLEAGGEILLTLAPMPASRPPEVVALPPVEAVVTTATLRVEGATGASVFVDGEQRGTAPCEITIDLGPLQEKSVEVVAQRTGYRSVAGRVTLQRGRTSLWRPELVRITPPPTPTVAGGKPWERPGSRAGEEIVGPGGIPLVWVPGGSFRMGSTDADIGDAVKHLGAHREWVEDEQPAHRVELSGFWIGKTEATVAQWRSVMGSVPGDANDQGDDHPLVDVTWSEAKEFCDRLGVALPTEAQWEYAARGRDRRRHPWGNEWDNTKCCNENNEGPGGRTFPVGSFPQGASWCGALDMAGNAYEWCGDRYASNYYKSSLARDPAGPGSHGSRVLRGGSWNFDANACRSANRNDGGPTYACFYIGFRIARSCR